MPGFAPEQIRRTSFVELVQGSADLLDQFILLVLPDQLLPLCIDVTQILVKATQLGTRLRDLLGDLLAQQPVVL